MVVGEAGSQAILFVRAAERGLNGRRIAVAGARTDCPNVVAACVAVDDRVRRLVIYRRRYRPSRLYVCDSAPNTSAGSGAGKVILGRISPLVGTAAPLTFLTPLARTVRCVSALFDRLA